MSLTANASNRLVSTCKLFVNSAGLSTTMLHNTGLHEATLNSSLFFLNADKMGRSRLSQVRTPTVCAEGDTFTNLDEEAALVNVLFDSLLRNINLINVAANSCAFKA